MVTKRGPGRPPKKRRGRPPGSKNKAAAFIYSNKEGWKPQIANFEYVKDIQPSKTPSFRSRLEAATVKFEQAVNETIDALKGKM